jgi:hypothetical protein
VYRAKEELSAPEFTGNETNERVRHLIEEKGRNRKKQNFNANGCVLSRKHFTFEVDTPGNKSGTTISNNNGNNGVSNGYLQILNSEATNNPIQSDTNLGVPVPSALPTGFPANNNDNNTTANADSRNTFNLTYPAKEVKSYVLLSILQSDLTDVEGIVFGTQYNRVYSQLRRKPNIRHQVNID